MNDRLLLKLVLCYHRNAVGDSTEVLCVMIMSPLVVLVDKSGHVEQQNCVAVFFIYNLFRKAIPMARNLTF